MPAGLSEVISKIRDTLLADAVFIAMLGGATEVYHAQPDDAGLWPKVAVRFIDDNPQTQYSGVGCYRPSIEMSFYGEDLSILYQLINRAEEVLSIPYNRGRLLTPNYRIDLLERAGGTTVQSRVRKMQSGLSIREVTTYYNADVKRLTSPTTTTTTTAGPTTTTTTTTTTTAPPCCNITTISHPTLDVLINLGDATGTGTLTAVPGVPQSWNGDITVAGCEGIVGGDSIVLTVALSCDSYDSTWHCVVLGDPVTPVYYWCGSSGGSGWADYDSASTCTPLSLRFTWSFVNPTGCFNACGAVSGELIITE